MIIALTLLVALAGFLMFLLSARPKLEEVGKILFFCGVLAFLLNGEKLVTLLPH